MFYVFGHILECFEQFFDRFSSLGAAFVRRHVGFKRFYDLGIDFCAQGRGF